MERYGNPTYNNTDKRKSTCIKKYGVENPQKSEEVKDKTKRTCLEKYGVENVFMNDEIKNKIRETNKQRYGKQHDFSNSDLLLKAIKNSHTDDSNQKRLQTCLERYGVPYVGCIFGIPNSRDSEPNKKFKALVESMNIPVDDKQNREVAIGKYRYDFKFDDILFEISPTITHNSNFSIYSNGVPKDKTYHYNKYLNAKENGLRCIQIFDWDDEQKIVEQVLADKEKLFARNCTIKEVDDKQSMLFLDKYHFQGYTKSSIRIGLYYKEKLVSIMTFGKPRYNKNCEYELIRYCTCAKVIGGSEKLFSYFIKNYNPSSIVSYCDYGKFSGKMYDKLGFQFLSVSIGKHWYNIKTKKHITNNLLLSLGYDKLFGTNYGKGTSNEQLMLDNGFLSIYDAGQATYIWKR